MRKARALTMALAILALVMLLISGPGTKAGWWPWMGAIFTAGAALILGAIAAVASLVLVAMLAVPKWRVQPLVPVISLCIALAAATPILILMSKAKGVPRIHDITTDMVDPPNFVALLEVRNQAPNGAAYGGATVAELQKSAYLTIGPKILDAPPKEAMQKAIDAARSLGWEVVASDNATGRIEATDTSAWFGFKDDVVIRIRPHSSGSRIDVRSVSRVGQGDIGANAERIRKFMGKL